MDELTRLWATGLSSSKIAKELGVPRNAVIGKAHRLKLTRRRSTHRKVLVWHMPKRKPQKLTSEWMPTSTPRRERREPSKDELRAELALAWHITAAMQTVDE